MNIISTIYIIQNVITKIIYISSCWTLCYLTQINNFTFSGYDLGLGLGKLQYLLGMGRQIADKINPHELFYLRLISYILLGP